MKIYRAYFQEYEDIFDVGVFSSRELAEQAIEHLWNKSTAPGKYFYYSKNQSRIAEYTVDLYIVENLSPTC